MRNLDWTQVGFVRFAVGLFFYHRLQAGFAVDRLTDG